MKKKLLSGLLAAALTLSLAACGGAPASESTAPSSSESAATSTADTAEADTTALTGDGFDSSVDYEALKGTTITVAASPVPHAEILKVAGEILAQADINLKVVEFTDYIQPNKATENGEVDANYFQHGPYLENFNEENGTHLVSVAAIHYEPLGLYPGKTKTLDELADGAKIGVPNDTTNEARALQLLAAQGLITLKDGAGLTATKNDIQDNPKNLDIVEMEAAQLPRQLASLDMAVINGNYATEAGFSSAADAIAAEDADSEAAQTYANVLVVKEGNEETPVTKALIAALKSQKVKDYITETYGGAVVAIF
ncbi:MetQ/NlpA family ABC transporter substrate-binding protein [Gemmiger formicilis]|uniref:MetQ/NlpA family ABC transporter substrate-binding protein n=1 Tax=Gemmiger formicilis TaxID=745368 RepID=UPI00195BC7CD|nr:MetQ/NlpA family ABC transporter substrate-binding protein [Gemmiger formicilis]MBM6717979.1 MetQ/NlpA family ABC transporter substrate-binding protein [Gemmiger formicilis]